MSRRQFSKTQRGSLFLSVNLDSLDTRDSHDLLCVVRQHQVPSTWITERVDHGWLQTVAETPNQSIALRWTSNAADTLKQAREVGLPIHAVVFERMSSVVSFRNLDNNVVGLWMDTQQANEEFTSKIGLVGSGVCEFSISGETPKMTSAWTDRAAKRVRHTLKAGERVHLRVQAATDNGPTVATRLDRILRIHASNVKSITAAAQLALRAKFGKPLRSILRPTG